MNNQVPAYQYLSTSTKQHLAEDIHDILSYYERSEAYNPKNIHNREERTQTKRRAGSLAC